MDLQLESSVPIYIQIKEQLQSRIKSGVYPAGSRLPSERELAQALKVSRITARQALQALAREDLTYSRAGKGTYVQLPKIDRPMSRLTSFTEDLQQRGGVPSSRVLKAAVQPAHSRLAEQMQLARDSEIALLRRLRLADGCPVGIETSHLAHDLCRGILDRYDFSHESLYRVLREDFGCPPVWCDQTIEVRLPFTSEAELLELDVSMPVLITTRITYTLQDRCIELVECVYRGDRHRLRVIQR